MNNYELLSYQSVAKQMNNRVYTNYFYRLMLIARSLFKWNNLPNGIDEKWIERYLFSEGSCVFYKDETLGFMVAKIGVAGTLNYYDEPTSVIPYATNYIFAENNPKAEDGKLYNNENCVIIRNNDDMIPTYPTIQLYSYDLTNIKRTIDTNIELQKIPYIILCSDKQKVSLKQLMKQKQDNEPVIYGDKNLDIDQIKTITTTAPMVFDKLQVQKMNVWNECMTFLGLNNANTDKKERLISNEVDANNQLIQANSDVMLKARQKACEQINEMFGTNISVERRTDIDIDKLFNDLDEDIDKEGESYDE